MAVYYQNKNQNIIFYKFEMYISNCFYVYINSIYDQKFPSISYAEMVYINH